MTNIVIANGPRTLDTGQETILFPSRWDSGIPNGGKAPFQFYPYELAYLSALLKRELSDDHVTMLDGNLEGWNGDRYIQEIAKLQPDFLITECSALTYPTMTRVMQTVTDRAYGYMQSILCGPMASEARTQEDGWEYAIQGEYELKVLSLLNMDRVPPEARTNGLINLDWLPWPEDSDIDRSRYYEINHYTPAPTIQMYLTRGCPLSCTFCVVPTYYGGHGKTSRSHRTRDVEDCCDEIEYLVHKYPGFAGAYFNEEAHSANPEWLASFCEALIRRGLNKYGYDAMCGMWTFTRELVALCRAAGYRQIRFGLESTSEQVGRAIKKTIHKDKTETFLSWLKEAGIGAYATVQVGAMGSTEESDRQTIADVKAWIGRGMIQKWQLSTSTPQPSTPFYAQAKENGWLTTQDINLYDGVRAVVNLPDYPAERIQLVRNGAGL